MTIEAFVDTNYFARFLLNDHETHSPTTRELFERVENGEFAVETSHTVVFELVYVIHNIAGNDRQRSADLISRLLSLDGLHVDEKQHLLAALDLWSRNTPLSFADCCHLIHTRFSSHRRILTFDKAMSNRIPEVERVESLPGQVPR